MRRTDTRSGQTFGRSPAGVLPCHQTSCFCDQTGLGRGTGPSGLTARGQLRRAGESAFVQKTRPRGKAVVGPSGVLGVTEFDLRGPGEGVSCIDWTATEAATREPERKHYADTIRCAQTGCGCLKLLHLRDELIKHLPS